MKLKFSFLYLCIRLLASIGSLSTFSMTSNNFIADSANICMGKFRKAGDAIWLKHKEIDYYVIPFLSK